METCGIPLVTELPIVEEKFTWTTEMNFNEACDVAALTIANKTFSKALLTPAHKDEKQNEWKLIYEKDESNTGTLGVQVSRPASLISYEGGLKPSAMKMKIFLSKETDITPIDSVDIAVTCISPGDIKTWKLGSIPEILNKLKGEKLTVEVNVEHFDYSSVLKEVNEDEEKVASAAFKKNPPCNVLGRFENLLIGERSSEFSDFQLKVKMNVFYLHKAILAVRCPLFCRMNAQGYFDCTIGERMSEDLSERTVEVLLHFVYTGKLALKPEDSIETLEELLPAIHKWDIPRLLKLVDLKIVEYATLDNAERLFEISSLYNLEVGVAAISRFIARNQRAIFALRKPNQCEP